MSVNSDTPKELCSVKFNDLFGAVEMCIKEGKGYFIAKSDMHSAF